MAEGETHRVLVIERDAATREDRLVPGLRAAGFEAVGVGEAAAARRCMLSRRYSVLVLDAGLRDGGVPFARGLRALTDAGIVALVDHRAGKRGRLLALEHGADVCLRRPEDIDVLVATIHNLLRRLRNAVAATAAWKGAPRWRIEAYGWNLVVPGGKALHLTHAERLLLETLTAWPGRAVPHAMVLSRLAGAMAEPDTQRLGKLVGRLRRKVAGLTDERLPLGIERGVGYVLHVDLAPHRAARRDRMQGPA